MAERQGLRLEKSRRRDPRALDYGTYALLHGPPPAAGGANWRERTLVAGDPNTGYGLDLDDVESWLTSDYYIDLTTPEGAQDWVGPAASVADLACPLAHALTIADKQGVLRPTYKIRAEGDDGQAREPNEIEQAAFSTALERALNDLRQP
jgi:hypothetical protein